LFIHCYLCRICATPMYGEIGIQRDTVRYTELTSARFNDFWKD
jgi:hypothetical protein